MTERIVSELEGRFIKITQLKDREKLVWENAKLLGHLRVTKEGRGERLVRKVHLKEKKRPKCIRFGQRLKKTRDTKQDKLNKN